MRTILVVIVTATVTVVVCQWRQEPPPFCCPGGIHERMEGGKWRHRFPEEEKRSGPVERQK